MPSPITIGSPDLVEQADSPEKSTTIDGVIYTLKYNGTLTAALAGEPAIGAVISGVADTTHSVAEVRITPGPGNRATLTIILRDNNYNAEAIDPETPYQDFSLDIAALDIPLERHPYYATAGSHSEFTERLGDTITLDAQDDDGNPIADTPSTDAYDIDVPLGVIWDQIKRLPFQQARQLYLRVPTANRVILTDIWTEWATGQDTATLYVPSGRVADTTLTTPSVGVFGRTVTAPTGLGWPEGFQCLRNGGAYNRPKKTGRFRREISYLGAPSFKAKFYPPE